MSSTGCARPSVASLDSRVIDILWLGAPGTDDPRVVGGKAASLSRLAARHRVPPGFCLTATAAGPDADGVRAAIAAAYSELGRRAGEPEPAVAVRSSAIDEDGAAASFAGQHDTFLNLVGADAVADAIGRCRASARSERALAYRTAQGLDAAGSIAVLVQELVPADVAAVVFSVDPRTGSDDIVINASWGLGESIVGGTATPDVYTVRRDRLEIRARTPGAKERMTVRTADGTREVPVPRILRERLALDDASVRAAAELALALEADTGAPVDVECAFRAGTLYLLQCRPVTATVRESGAR